VFVLGAEEAAVNLIRELARSPQWKVVGVFDDDITKRGRQLHGANVLGGLDDLPQWKQKLGIQHAIIAMPEASHSARRHAVELCRNAELDVLTVPSFDDLMSGRVTVSQIRHVELDDLLGRDRWSSTRRGSKAGSAAVSFWSVAPAARSAPSCAGSSRALRRGSLSSSN